MYACQHEPVMAKRRKAFYCILIIIASYRPVKRRSFNKVYKLVMDLPEQSDIIKTQK